MAVYVDSRLHLGTKCKIVVITMVKVKTKTLGNTTHVCPSVLQGGNERFGKHKLSCDVWQVVQRACINYVA